MFNLFRKKTHPNCICVIGMHRSGTSCLTGIMQNMGVELGDVFTTNPANKKGNRENSRIVFLNEAVLLHNDSSWDNPTVVTRWTTAMAKERDAIIRELRARNHQHWGFKDTRTLFTLPFWLQALDKPDFIGTFRHPLRVARSLRDRDGADIDASLELWHSYNVRLLQVTREYNTALVNFDSAPEDYLNSTIDKLVALGLEQSHVPKAREFFDADLRNQANKRVDDNTLPEHINSLYAELLNYAQVPAQV